MEETVIIIPVEHSQNFNTHETVNRSALNGIEYAKYLRRVKKETQPIVFTSFLSPNDILDQPHTAILTAIGHEYLQLPYSDEEYAEILRGVKPLNDIQLKDIILNFCQLRSAVRESCHAFKGRIRAIKSDKMPPAVKSAIYQKEFENYEAELLKDVGSYPEIIKEYKRIIALYDPNDEQSIELIETVLQEENFTSYLPADEDDIQEMVSGKKPWKVLFLDDKPDELASVLTTLDDRAIGYAVATSSDEAKSIIEKDKVNEFNVVVSDFRLSEPDTEGWHKPKMQKEQGYDFLLWLSKQNRYNAMIALSGLSKWFLMDSFRQHQINVKVYSKSGLLGGGAKLFVDDLEYHGRRVFDVIASQPQAVNWATDTKKQDKITNYALKPYYVYHRSQSEYLTVENNINRQAEQFARELEYALDKNANFNFASMVSLQGNATTTMKGKIAEEYPIFQLKLLQRRVFLYMILKGFERNAISKLLHKGDSEHEMTESMIKQIPGMLAIQTEKDLPFNILVEEKYFLQHQMALPLFEVAELMDQSFVLFNNIINDYLKERVDIKEELRNYVVGTEGVIKTVSMTDTLTVTRKICDLLLKEKRSKEALDLVNAIENIAIQIKQVLPSYKSFDKTISELNKQKEKLLK